MIDREILTAYLDDALDPEARTQVEAQLASDPEALRYIVEQRKMDRLLSSVLQRAAHKQRVKQSILAAVRGIAPEQLKARVLQEALTPTVVPRETAAKPNAECRMPNDQGNPNDEARIAPPGAERPLSPSALLRWFGETLQRFNVSTVHRLALGAAVAVLALGIVTFFIFRTQRIEPITVGQFASVMGAPKVQHAGQRAAKLHASRSTAVCLGDRIQTGDADKAEIKFNDGTTLRLNFNTALEIPNQKSEIRNPKSPPSRPSEVKLLAGHVWAKVEKASQTRFDVHTPVATAAVKGTEFGLKVRKAEKPKPETRNSKLETNFVAVLTVKEGAVEFSNDSGTVQATEMTESTATSDSAPTQPIRLKTLKSFPVAGGKALNVGGEDSGFELYGSAVRLVYPQGWSGFELQTRPKAQAPQNLSPTLPRIVRVGPGSPADKAGLVVGDIITHVNGQAVANLQDTLRPVLRRPNTLVDLTVLHGDTPKSVSLTTTEHPYALPFTDLPADVAAELFDATWPLIEEGCGDQMNPAQWSKIEENLKQVLDRYPNCAAVHNNLAVWHEAKDDIGAAIHHFKQAVQLEPDNALFHYNLGLVLRSIGNFERLAEEMEAAVRIASTWPLAAKSLAEAYGFLDRHDEALAAVERALAANPLYTGLWRQKALILLISGKPAEALKAVLKAVELEPANFGAQGNLGSIYWALGENDAAEAAHRKAIELNPDWAEGYQALALVLINRLDGIANDDLWTKSANEFQLDRWKNREPKQAAFLAEAERLFRRAIELKPDSAQAYQNFGQLYLERGEPEEAEKMFRKASELDPSSEVTVRNNNELAWMFAIWDIRLDDALNLAEQNVQINPADWGFVDTLALVHFRRGEWDEAEKALKKCIELGGPKDSGDWYHLGKVYEKKNNVQAAIAAYEKALRVQPDYPHASQALQQLRR